MKKIFFRWTTVLIAICIFVISCTDKLVNGSASKKLKSGTSTLTVFPIQIIAGTVKSFDNNYSKRLGDFLREKKIANVVFDLSEPNFNCDVAQLQIANLKDCAANISKYTIDKKIKTDFALYIIFSMNTETSGFNGLYYFIVDNVGKIAMISSVTPQQEIFTKVNPSGRNDGFKLFCLDFNMK